MNKNEFKTEVKDYVNVHISSALNSIEKNLRSYNPEFTHTKEIYIESITVLEKIRQKVENDEI